jgi:DNA-directed RNA polymerase specialized sigma24 family protein
VCEPAAPVPASPQSDLDFARGARELARRCPGARERLVELARMLADEERDAVQLVCGESRGLSEVGAIMHRTNGKVARLLASGLSRLAVLMRNKGLRPPVVRPAVQLTIEGA